MAHDDANEEQILELKSSLLAELLAVVGSSKTV
jgi:hypothetical protein